MAVTRIARITLTTADPESLAAFYRSAFGFERIGAGAAAHAQADGRAQAEERAQAEGRAQAGWARAEACAPADARVLALSLGPQILELIAFREPGNPYPRGSASNDPRFQHFAIVVSSMEAAYARLRQRPGWTSITTPAPQHLPARSGGVVAFKFRDPEGHPLELLEFPTGRIPAAWQAVRAEGPCLGIDHSAIVVADTARSADFYERLLGFSRLGRSLNRGPEQERLDALPDAVVEVTALGARRGEPPHLELLCYRSPPSPAALQELPTSHDIAATRLTLEVEDLAGAVTRLAAAGVRLAAAEATALEGPRAAATRDPDGHALLLLERAAPIATRRCI